MVERVTRGKEQEGANEDSKLCNEMIRTENQNVQTKKSWSLFAKKKRSFALNKNTNFLNGLFPQEVDLEEITANLGHRRTWNLQTWNLVKTIGT